ncbi:tricarballylate dehydrogenase [Thermoplasmatales archaeon]|nr:tricarballylate dehydrogenase [Thermoplasmatales archaeon]
MTGKPVRKYDVLVIGGGNAGLCAALSAAKHSGKVLLIESAHKNERGGNTKYTRDIRYAHNPDAYSAGSYSDEEFVEDVVRVTHNKTNQGLLKKVIAESWNIPAWLEDHDVIIHKALKGTLHLGRTNLFMLGGGKAMINSYYDAAEKEGVEIRYETRCSKLELDGKRVFAAEIHGRDGKETIEVGSVVVASGGFEANLDWLGEYWGDAAKNFIVRGSRQNTGDMLRMLVGFGARTVGDLSQFHSVAVDARSPKYDGGIVTRIDSIPFGITVNKSGKRFYDEGEDLWPKRYAIWGRLIAEQPDQEAYSIIDSKARDLFLPTVFEPEVGESITELAAKLGLNPDTLSETVREYNNSASGNCTFDPGSLDDCKTSSLEIPKSHWARAIDTPPYYGYPFRPGITFTYFGVMVNEMGQVISNNGTPFGNLFAAGEIMSGNILSEGYLAGFGLTIGTVFGVTAGREAAAYAGK